MTARQSQTSPRLHEEHAGGVFLVLGDAPPRDSGPGGGGPGGPGGVPFALTRRVQHIFEPVVHGSPSAPVLFGRPALTEAFRRAMSPRHIPAANHHQKGTT